MGSSRETERRHAPLMFLAAAVAMAFGAASCGRPAPPTEPLAGKREIPLERLLELPGGAVAETSLDPPLQRPSGVGTPESDAVLPEWLDVGVGMGSERTQAVDPSHDVQSRKAGVSVGWTGEREEEGKRGPSVALEAEVREDTTPAHPDEKTRDESIGLRVIVPFRATREAESR